jgi:hypothetical protein
MRVRRVVAGRFPGRRARRHRSGHEGRHQRDRPRRMAIGEPALVYDLPDGRLRLLQGAT